MVHNLTGIPMNESAFIQPMNKFTGDFMNDSFQKLVTDLDRIGQESGGRLTDDATKHANTPVNQESPFKEDSPEPVVKIVE